MLGNFDGIHLGHQTMLKAALARAEALGAPMMVYSFKPHPRQVLRPNDQNFRLAPFREKYLTLRDLGVDHLILRHFDKEFARLPAEDFVEQELIARLAPKVIYVGDDFCFGQGRSGNVDLLREYAQGENFELVVHKKVVDENGIVISSSRVREALQAGDVKAAQALLGRPWMVSEHVVHGEGRGHKLGFPTANMPLKNRVRPLQGVYALWVRMEDRLYPSVGNLGSRPTFGGGDILLEVHLLDFSGDLYGKRLDIFFMDLLRIEKKFDGIDALKAAISADTQTAKQILEKNPL